MSYNLDRSRTSPNSTPGAQAKRVFGYDRVIEGITIHWWGDPNQNPSFAGIRDYLCRQNGTTSAHFVASGTGRQVAWIVDANDVAWHSGSAWGNARTIGIELDPRARDIDYDVAAELIADIRSAFGDVPIYWHNYFIATQCPGVWSPERLDALSYTKYSADEWGQGGNKTAPAPVEPPVVTPPVPAKELYKLTVSGKQVGAYSTDTNAYNAYVYFGKDPSSVIKLGAKDVTAEVISKFTAPSPTADPPEQGGGAPVAEKPDYSQENNGLLKQILAIVQAIMDKLTGVFK